MRFDIAKGNESGFVGKILYVEGESVDFMSNVWEMGDLDSDGPSFPSVG